MINKKVKKKKQANNGHNIYCRDCVDVKNCISATTKIRNFSCSKYNFTEYDKLTSKPYTTVDNFFIGVY